MKYSHALFAFIILIFFVFSGCASTTPLIKASASGDSLAVQKLINEGANINEPDSRGMTPLMYTIQYNNIEMVEALIKKGADVKIKDKSGCTPLYYAVSAGNCKLVKMLIDKGADINLGDNYKRTPLMNIAYDNIDMVKLLIENGADVNAKDYAGKTALMFASSPVIVGILIDKGADVYAKNNEGYTVLQDAYYLKDIEKVAIIRKKTNWKEQDEQFGLYEALKNPSFYKPEPNMFDVPKDKELAYNTAVYDCNNLSTTGKTGLLLATGPVGYVAGMAFDAVTVPRKFQNCMVKMGFECKNNCSK
jgi:ankyrin repeat protein